MRVTIQAISLVALTVVALGLSGCSSTKTNNTDSDSATESVGNTTGEEDTSAISESEVGGESDAGKAGQLQTVYFEYNISSLAGSARDTLKQNAEYLKENNDVKIRVEGHCDERGGVQYNLALGERRSKNVRNFLVGQGVSASRIETVSYGKERPLEFGHDESSWSRNRRGNFIITEK